MRLQRLHKMRRIGQPKLFSRRRGFCMSEARAGIAARKSCCSLKRRCVLLMAMCALLVCAKPARSEWQSFDKYDGLAGNYVYAILEDSLGALWFGTDGGVSQYDGVSWTTYTESGGLSGNSVRAMLEDGSALGFAKE